VSKYLYYMGYHVNIMQYMQPKFLLTDQVCPRDGAHSSENYPFEIGCIILYKGRCFHLLA